MGDPNGTARRVSSGTVVRRAALLTRRPPFHAAKGPAHSIESGDNLIFIENAYSRCTLPVASRGPGANEFSKNALASSMAVNTTS